MTTGYDHPKSHCFHMWEQGPVQLQDNVTENLLILTPIRAWHVCWFWLTK